MQTYKIIENNHILINQPKLISLFGRAGAQLICQLHYWIAQGCGEKHNNTQWIYNTAKEWGEQIQLSERQVRHYIKKFSEKGILLVKKLNQKKYNQTNYITINYDALNDLIDNQIKAPSQPAVSADSSRQLPQVLNKETKITNKDINKSEGLGKYPFQQRENLSISSQQVEQVKKNNLKDYKTIKSNFCDHPEKALEQQQPLKVNTAKEMVDLWNQFFPKSNATLNKDLSKNLVAAFKLKFKSDMNLWKHYLKKIESSSYLTGESFQLSLYWALKFLTIDRIGQGDFGVKDIVIHQKTEDLKSKFETHIESLNESDRLKDVRLKIAIVIGYQSYLSWFTQVSFFENENGIHFKANSTFAQDYIMAHFGHLFKI
ncbi:MAG: hypothetical protein KBD31_05095 [Proteobacteria bacterium]|nr:hypothetical protein [Pseudomonadota bacterium]